MTPKRPSQTQFLERFSKTMIAMLFSVSTKGSVWLALFLLLDGACCSSEEEGKWKVETRQDSDLPLFCFHVVSSAAGCQCLGDERLKPWQSEAILSKPKVNYYSPSSIFQLFSSSFAPMSVGWLSSISLTETKKRVPFCCPPRLGVA